MNMPVPQGQAPAPVAQAAPVAAAAPAPTPGVPAPVQGGNPEALRGAQRVSNTEFNPQMQNILLSRIEEEGTKNPNFGQAIDQGLSREAALEIALVLPELMPIFKQMGVLDEVAPQQGSIQTPTPAAPTGPSAGVGINPNANIANPILREGTSQGLVG